MASNKTVAAAFAAGLAGGGVGGDQVAQQEIDQLNTQLVEVREIVADHGNALPTIRGYVANAARFGVTSALDERMTPIRADQLRQIVEDMREDVASCERPVGDDGETVTVEDCEAVPLTELVSNLRLKVRTDDPLWWAWYDEVLAGPMLEQITIGQAVGALKPDQTVRIVDVLDTLAAVAVEFTPETPVE